MQDFFLFPIATRPKRVMLISNNRLLLPQSANKPNRVGHG